MSRLNDNVKKLLNGELPNNITEEMREKLLKYIGFLIEQTKLEIALRELGGPETLKAPLIETRERLDKSLKDLESKSNESDYEEKKARIETSLKRVNDLAQKIEKPEEFIQVLYGQDVDRAETYQYLINLCAREMIHFNRENGYSVERTTVNGETLFEGELEAGESTPNEDAISKFLSIIGNEEELRSLKELIDQEDKEEEHKRSQVQKLERASKLMQMLKIMDTPEYNEVLGFMSALNVEFSKEKETPEKEEKKGFLGIFKREKNVQDKQEKEVKKLITSHEQRLEQDTAYKAAFDVYELLASIGMERPEEERAFENEMIRMNNDYRFMSPYSSAHILATLTNEESLTERKRYELKEIAGESRIIGIAGKSSVVEAAKRLERSIEILDEIFSRDNERKESIVITPEAAQIRKELTKDEVYRYYDTYIGGENPREDNTLRRGAPAILKLLFEGNKEDVVRDLHEVSLNPVDIEAMSKKAQSLIADTVREANKAVGEVEM